MPMELISYKRREIYQSIFSTFKALGYGNKIFSIFLTILFLYLVVTYLFLMI